MHPWDHARSSARLHGGRPEAFLAYHAWFDATKAARAHVTHRALRHHDEGLAEAATHFGDRITVTDDKTVATETLGRQHLAEDVGGDHVTAADWLRHADPDKLPADIHDPDALANESALRFGGDAADYRTLHAWFLQTRSWFPDPRHLIMRNHAFGIFDAEARFGIVLHPTNAEPVATRIVAEHHVRRVMGSIPSADALLRTIRPQRWMSAATSPRRLGLDRSRVRASSPA